MSRSTRVQSPLLESPISRSSFFSHSDSSTTLSSGNSAKRLKERNSDTEWVVKEIPELLAQLEVSAAALFRHLLPGQAPIMREVLDCTSSKVSFKCAEEEFLSADVLMTETTIGTASKYYPGAISMGEFLDGTLPAKELAVLLEKGLSPDIKNLFHKPLEEKITWLFDHGLVEALTLLRLLQDDDVHRFNLLIVEDRVVSIDFDLALCPFVINTLRRDYRSNIDAPKPSTLDDRLSLSPADIKEFLFCADGKGPFYWPTSHKHLTDPSYAGWLGAKNGYHSSETQAFIRVFKIRYKEAQEKIFYTATKLFLLSPETIKEIFSYDSVETYLVSIIKNHRAAFLDCAEFLDWFKNKHPDCFSTAFKQNPTTQYQFNELQTDVTKRITELSGIPKLPSLPAAANGGEGKDDGFDMMDDFELVAGPRQS